MRSGSVSGWLVMLGGMATGRTARDGAATAPSDRRTGIAGRPTCVDVAPYRAILDDHLIAAAMRTDAALSNAAVAARFGAARSGTRISPADPAATTPASP